MSAPSLDAANLLDREVSPYLLQHAGNPVHWRPWGEAALAAARAASRPILLSIGYAACHWCHVMAHESFENAETAALMNRLFVNIKVDREERPDIDHLYMTALHALGEQGGWPLTMFLTPDGAPFWGGTYFPPEPRWGRPSFRQVLEAIAAAWQSGEAAVHRNAAALTRALAQMASTRSGGVPDQATLHAAAASLLRATDQDQGGLRGAPKFPNPPIFRFLWQAAYRGVAPGGESATHLLLERMSQGGIYDHLGGGYARYSTDADWLVPHFEKMLYDNAQILELLALAHAARPGMLYADRAAETVAWLVREMRVGDAFAASQDADSEGEEGRFYVWTEAEIDAALGAEAALFKSAYDVTKAGNWEGRTILRRNAPPLASAAEATLARCRAILLEARARRLPPARDDKVLADWNGLAIVALTRAAVVFRRPDWLALAEKAFDFILRELGAADGRVQHAWRAGRASAAGLLDDQAALARAGLALYEATGAPDRLAVARALVESARRWFGADGGGFYVTASDAADVPLGPAVRPRSAGDNATPSGAGLMADVLARLYHLTGEDAFRVEAEAAIAAFTGQPLPVGVAEDQPAMSRVGTAMASPSRLSAFPTLLAAADLLAHGTAVVITGPAEDPCTQRLHDAALAAPDPAVVVLRVLAGTPLPPGHPAAGKTASGHGSAAYLCREQICSLPISDPGELAARLGAAGAMSV